MNWELLITGASALAAAVAAGLAGWQAREARKSRKSADDSAAEVATAQQRIAKAIEQLNPPRSAVWEVTHHTGHEYALTNVGGETAVGVQVNTDSAIQPSTRFARIQDRSQETVLYVGTADGGTRQIHVTWHHPKDAMDDPPHEWNGLIPDRP